MPLYAGCDWWCYHAHLLVRPHPPTHPPTGPPAALLAANSLMRTHSRALPSPPAPPLPPCPSLQSMSITTLFAQGGPAITLSDTHSHHNTLMPPPSPLPYLLWHRCEHLHDLLRQVLLVDGGHHVQAGIARHQATQQVQGHRLGGGGGRGIGGTWHQDSGD